jgi:transcriptional regulator with XRE-family HTH domain
MDTSREHESFRGLLLRHRGRTGLIQRDLAARAGVSRPSVQDWESGVNYPTAERLRALIRVLLVSGGLNTGREATEARELWAAAEREAPRMHTPFDDEWFAAALAARRTQTSEPLTHTLHDAPAAERAPRAVERAEDWGEAPDTMGFVGRVEQLSCLRRWVLEEHCRLIAIVGMGGIGKTILAARVASDVAPTFERIYWRSLRDAPPVIELLAGAIGFFSDQQSVPPAAESERIAMLLQLVRERRCLLVLDNSETLFEPSDSEGRYRSDMAGYGRLFQTLGEASHQSCLMLTSREAPPELASLGGAARTFELGGLDVEEARVLLAPKRLGGTDPQWAQLNARYGGNSLALKVVGQSITELFDGDIGSFLEEAGDSSVFGGIRRLLAVMQGHSGGVWSLAFAARAQLLASGDGNGTVRLWSLTRVLGRLGLPEIQDETNSGQQLATLVGHSGTVWGVALSSDGQLLASGGTDGTVRLWETGVERQLAILQGHTGGVWRVALSADGRLVAGGGANDGFVRLWETATGQPLATLQGHTGVIWGLALSADGRLLASGGGDGTVRLWDTSSGRQLATLQGNSGAVYGLALSTDGELLTSSTEDGTVSLWDARNGRPLATLLGHTGAVYSVALSADRHLLASGSFDGTVKIWSTDSGALSATLRAERRYERLDITGLTGITDAQRLALIALGAVEQRQ